MTWSGNLSVSTLFALQVERNCLDVMARTASAAGTSDPVLAQAPAQHNLAHSAHTLTEAGNDAYSRFCQNLLPAETSDQIVDTGQDGANLLHQAEGIMAVEHTCTVVDTGGQQQEQHSEYGGQRQRMGKRKQTLSLIHI